MRMLLSIIAAMFLFQVSIYAQESAQVTLSIRLYPIQTIEVESAQSQPQQLSDQNTINASPSAQLSTFSTSQHATRVDSVKCKGFEALRAARELPPETHKSINQIFRDESNYYQSGETDEMDMVNMVYSMETL